MGSGDSFEKVSFNAGIDDVTSTKRRIVKVAKASPAKEDSMPPMVETPGTKTGDEPLKRAVKSAYLTREREDEDGENAKREKTANAEAQRLRDRRERKMKERRSNSPTKTPNIPSPQPNPFSRFLQAFSVSSHPEHKRPYEGKVEGEPAEKRPRSYDELQEHGEPSPTNKKSFFASSWKIGAAAAVVVAVVAAVALRWKPGKK